ncbi:MAG: 23S rRNA (adenine(2503)-C(2))-methyltransferase RlmN [Thermomicrobiales bacterium]|nr:23S rRNA (adenine(2503)-C(2))-methyltransferase RlmN [Thermomicrobiales bacterium]
MSDSASINSSLPVMPVSRRKRLVGFYDLSVEDLTDRLETLGAPRFRAKQMYNWGYEHFVESYGDMKNLPAALQEQLEENLPFRTMEMVDRKVTDDGDTYKLLYETFDGQVVETVLMLYPDRATVCVSCQVGCAVGCAFCATGLGGLTRSLSAGEIVQQTVDAARQAKALGRNLTNLVMMGMGEPLQNYAETMKFINIIHDPRGLNFGARRITISTSGIVPRIDALADEPLQLNLAVSLHAPNNDLRGQLVPVNGRWPVEDLLAACDRYIAKTGRRISFEYALMNGINNSDEVAHELGELLRGRLCHVNVIPFNPVEVLDFERPTVEMIDRFAAIVQSHGVPTTVRYSRGVEIDAACGQLRARYEATRGKAGVQA